MVLLNRVLKFRGFLALFLLALPTAGLSQHYIQTNLVSNAPSSTSITASTVDPQLINPWGLSRSTTGPWWVSDNGTGVSTIYNGAGAKQALVVTIPVPSGHSAPSTPTGVVFNGTDDFKLPGGTASRFIFVTQEGAIAAWNSGPSAVIVVNNSSKEAIYMGCTIGEADGKHYLYVANFHSGEIEVYDGAFHRVQLDQHPSATGTAATTAGPTGTGNGNDAFKENMHNYAPFNVQAIGTNIYVAYAKQDEDKEDEVAGPGLGFVTVFDTSGRRLNRLQSGMWFNAPWGMAMAPGEYGEFSHSLLVGMFGSGQIAAFNPINGAFLGLMKTPEGANLSVDGLWAIGFGGGNANSGPHNTLYFTAGPHDEMDGLFGTLVPIPAELSEADEP